MKKIIINLLLMLSAVFLCFVLIEICLRAFYPQIVECKINEHWRMKDDVLPYVPKPCYKGRMFLKGQFDVCLTTNNKGFRGAKDVDIERPRNITRVVFLGDSFVFGWGVDDDKVFTYTLEERFNKEEDVEVINASVYGYDMDEYLVAFDRIFKYDPNVIFLGFCLENDFNFSISEKGSMSEELRAEREDTGSHIREIINNLHIITLIRDRLYITFPKIRNIMLSLGINNKRDIFLKSYPESLNKLLVKTESALDHMNKVSKENGIDFIVLLIPLKEQIYCRQAISKFQDYDIDKPNEVLTDILKRNSIQYIDLTSDLLTQSRLVKERLYFDTDPHWTEYGHEIVGQIIYNKYKDAIIKKGK